MGKTINTRWQGTRVNVDPELGKLLKVIAILEDRSPDDIVNELLRKHMDKVYPKLIKTK
jgi:hypothetical protein